MKVLVSEKLESSGLELLQQHADVDVKTNLTVPQLLAIMPQYDALVVRSKTQVDAALLAAGTRLQVVGRAGTGVDNIDVDAATQRGIAVVNAPTGNSNAVAEQTVALMLAMARLVYPAVASMKAGRWEKSALQGTEVKGKTLGLVGLGRIGRMVASKAKGLEMQIVAFDPYASEDSAASLGAKLLSLEEVLRQSDYISIHTPLTAQTTGMIGEAELALCKPTAYLINCARGGIIDEAALKVALREKRLGGAALDVFSVEPVNDPELIALPNLLATPHLGASTAEAQNQVAIDVCQAVIDVLEGRLPETPVNIPYVTPQAAGFLRPYIDLAQRMGAFFIQWHDKLYGRLELIFEGELCDYDTRVLTSAFLAGLLSHISDEHINVVNALHRARERGLVVSAMCRGPQQVYGDVVRASFPDAAENTSIAGTVIYGEPHLVELDGQRLDAVIAGPMLVDLHHDRPGIVGPVGQILGEAGINISFVQMSRVSRGGPSIMVLALDEVVPESLLARILAVPNVQRVRRVDLPPAAPASL
jgi:D-3-phosphoglycerate dehydrogenase